MAIVTDMLVLSVLAFNIIKNCGLCQNFETTKQEESPSSGQIGNLFYSLMNKYIQLIDL